MFGDDGNARDRKWWLVGCNVDKSGGLRFLSGRRNVTHRETTRKQLEVQDVCLCVCEFEGNKANRFALEIIDYIFVLILMVNHRLEV